MKPLRTGSPIDDIVMTKKIVANTGIPRKAAVGRYLAGVAPLVDHADEQEQRAGRDPVIELMDDAAGDAQRREREHPQNRHAHVAHARIGDQTLPVALRQRDERAVDDADNRERLP